MAALTLLLFISSRPLHVHVHVSAERATEMITETVSIQYIAQFRRQTDAFHALLLWVALLMAVYLFSGHARMETVVIFHKQ